MLKMLRFSIMTLCAFLVSGGSYAQHHGAQLKPVGSSTLEKTTGRVDQVVATADGGFLTRDYDWRVEKSQAIELFDASGKRIRKISGFGRGPGKYYRLKEIALGDDNQVWVADVQGRLSLFDLNGKFTESKLIQRPGYRVRGLALDKERGKYFLTGCLPLMIYLDDGCHLIHQYDLESRTYRKSFLETDPEIIEKNLLPLEEYRLDVAPNGKVFFTNGPLMKLYRIDPVTEKVDIFPIDSKIAKTAVALRRGANRAENQMSRDSAYLIDRVLVSADSVFVSIRKPYNKGFLLQVFDLEGRQTSIDLPSPGQLVGKTADESLFFVSKAEAFEVATYTYQPADARSANGGIDHAED